MISKLKNFKVVFFFLGGLDVKFHKRYNGNMGSLKDLEGSRMLHVKGDFIL